MKSKSFEMAKKSADRVKQNRTYDFVNFYKSASDASVQSLEESNHEDWSSNQNVVSTKLLTPKRASNKKNKKDQNNSVNISKININGDNLSYADEGPGLDDSKVTSTPNVIKKDVKPKVKSIIKNKSLLETSVEVSNVSMTFKPKKRNKSVSFMLDDTEGVAIKRSKSEETINKPEKPDKSLAKTKKPKKSKKKQQDEKENKCDTPIDIVPTENIATTSELNVNHTHGTIQKIGSHVPHESKEIPEKKNYKKIKKPKTVTVDGENSVAIKIECDEPKIKKIKKKKRHITPNDLGTDKAETDGEPAIKSSKKDVKPDRIAQDMENLNIGDNAHTLTNLLDEMTVVDKNKKKKNKQKHKDVERKQKKHKVTSTSSTNSEGEDTEKKKGKDKKQKIDKTIHTNDVPVQSTNTEGEVSEEKEKVKWVKRKWNKDKKGIASVDKHLTSIIIENLPFKVMFTYKKLLAEHFEKFGMIRQVGIAEMYPTEDPKPVFATTINFYSEDGAEKALEEDNALLEGARIRVKRPLPPTLTTLVVRSYAELTEQGLSSAFAGAGRIRSIRHLVKGKKSSSTAFIEFDGPKSVERAIKMAEDAKIGGKKIHVAKFELRATNKKKRQEKSEQENEGSDSSNE